MARKDSVFIDAARRPAIWLQRGGHAASRSKVGGLPELPPGVLWPRQGRTKTPLHFLAQIDLASLPATPLIPGGPTLPPRGLLSFFADVEEEMLWDDEFERGTSHDTTRVIFSESVGARVAPPEDIPQIGHAWGEAGGGRSVGDHVYPESPLTAYPIDSFVGITRPMRTSWGAEADEWIVASIERATGRAVPIVDSTTRETDLPEQPFIVDWGSEKALRILRHQMLGAPLNVNMDADAMEGHGEVLLLQLEPDFPMHRNFIGGGTVQFWIKAVDLAAKRFERAYATYRH
jgi:uncharacterized protein YwqG